jgi:hypothetical protein
VATLEGRYTVKPERWVIYEGFSYSFPALKFHHSPLPLTDVVSVTCVEKHNQRPAPGRVIYPLKYEPVMAFGHDQNPALIRAIVEEAREALR